MGHGGSRPFLCFSTGNVIHPESLKQNSVVPVTVNELPAKKPVASLAHAAPTTPKELNQQEVAPPSLLERRLMFLHFNDIYNIEPSAREPVGGASRLAYTVKSLAHEKPLVVFSGDAFNPSLLSTITLGAQMPPVLNKIGVNVACIGNHDFDFGTDQLMKLVKQCNFPWLMANVLDKETKKPYANALSTYMVDWNGIKVGFAGLVEEEWLETLGAVNPKDLEYVDFVEEGHRLAKQLKEEGAEVLVAVTHMRVPNDKKLAAQCPEFHVVMGGHDHHYQTEYVEPHNVLMVKSGTDFRDLTRVDVVLPAGGGQPQVTWTRLTMDSAVPEDPEVKEIVDGYMGKMAERTCEVIGHTLCELDGRFLTVRMKESNLGNFLCDVMRKATRADVVLINGGTFRSDVVHPPGPFTLGDMMSILPMMDGTIVLEATGDQIVQGLENGVCMYPKLEGRFPQVSGVSFMFDAEAPPKNRIVPGSVLVGGEPIDMAKKYSFCTKPYVAEGKDGYDVFKQCRVLVPEEGAALLPTALRNHFRYLEILNLWDPKTRIQKFARKWSSKVIAKRSSKNLLATGEEAEAAAMLEYLPARSYTMTTGDTGLCVLQEKYCVKPVVDGRIMIMNET